MIAIPVVAFIGMAILSASPDVLAAETVRATHSGGAAYPDEPVLAHTGGFGEPTCRACHFDNPLDSPGGNLIVEGWPDRATRGETYELTVRVGHEELALAGFQLSVRTHGGQQAGDLTSPDHRSDVTAAASGIRYAHHTLTGTEPSGDREATWAVQWTAPDCGGDVLLHVTANAANGDRSEFGDFIFADSLQTTVE